MTTSSSKQPVNWDDYEYGRSPRQGSVGSRASVVHFDGPSPASTSDRLDIPHRNGENGGSPNALRRRRSSISMRIHSLAQVGGPNSIENFARSWQRAAGFFEITPSRSSYRDVDDTDAESGARPSDAERVPRPHKSLLRQQLEQDGSPTEEAVVETPDTVEDNDGGFIARQSSYSSSDGQKSSIVAHAPYLASTFASSYAGTYGSLTSRVNDSSMRHAGELFRQQQVAGTQEPDKEREPLLVKRVEREDGKVVNVVVGQSTLPQTIFNSVNVLIGVGLLSLPLGIKYAGWLIGVLFLFLSAIVTSYTAGLLAKCLDVDNSLITFADLAFVSFGARARVATSILFTVELIAACVALMVLFADSLDALIPGLGIIEWKLVCGIILIPLSFVPLRMLSISSVVGILSCLGIVLLVFVDGLIKPHSPGSLREPAMTALLPQNWSVLPLSLGILMSPWGGHSVFPNIYRDMRHPQKYSKGLKFTYGFTYLLDMSMGVIGLLMFGDHVHDEITSNILLTKGYPRAVSVFIVVFIAVIPLTKIPLNARPIISTIEIFCGLDARAVSPSPRLIGLSGWSRGLLKCTIRIATIVVILIIAILVPSFDRIMALMGSALCFTICIILPLTFYLKLFGDEISMKERVLDWFLIVICSVIAVIGTVWACLPKDKIGSA